MAKTIRGRGGFERSALGIVAAIALVLAGCTADPVESPGATPDAAAPDGIVDSPAGEMGGPAVAVIVAPATGIVTAERGSQATFTVVLGAVPTAEVTIAVASGDTSEGAVTPAMLRFSPSNALAPQTVTVTGVDDAEKDGDVTYRIDLAAAVSTDVRFAGLDVPDMMVTNVDDESAGISVIASGGLRTTEPGGEVTFAVVLNSQPKANVTVPVTSDDDSEGTVTPATLTFTPANWGAPQTVTAAGVDDPDNDGDVAYTITLGPSASGDADYQGLMLSGPTIENVDDETPGLLVTGDNLRTTEVGAQATFTVALRTRPGADVTIPVVSGDASEGVAAPASLVFTPLNWNAPRTVTVTGVDDDVADGNQIYKVNLGPAQSLDADYAGLAAMSSSIANTDDDGPGVTVTAATSPLLTSEAGTQATFTVVLDSRPTANVTIGLSSSKTSEGTVSPSSLTFTPDNWSAPQIVTVTGVNDAVADGTQVYAIVTAPAVSSDTSGYSGLDPADVVMGNTDDDSAGFVVSAISGPLTESGDDATFTVALTSKPSASVTIGIASSDSSEATVTPAALTFTADNWNAPQTVTATGVDDAIADGNQVFSIVTSPAVSSDMTGYDGLNPVNVAVVTIDNDSAGFTVSAISGATTEAGGTATFTVALTSQPNANVSIAVSSSDTGEGTVAPAALTFTVDNWNAPQTVTVTGVDDAMADGNQVFSIVTAAATSGDSGYDGLDPANVGVTNTDNDSAGFSVGAISGNTSEAGATATFTVALTSQPGASVVVGLSSSDTGEGTVAPASLTFTAANWNAPQTVTVTGVDDALADGNQPYTVVTAAAVSSDAGYNGLDPANVSVSNTDNDTGTATFTVVLTSQPSADVSIGITSSDTSEGTVLPASLTFTAMNWNSAQTVTVTGVNDALADGNQPYSIVTAAAVSGDAGYDGLDPANVSVSNTDNDTAGVTVGTISGTTSEAGGTATFTVVLTSQPTADVTIGLSSNDTTEGTVLPASLTFTAMNWNVAQTVTVTGVDDALADGNQPFTIVTAAATSSDSGYSGLDPANVSVTNDDDDSAGITVGTISGATTEAGGTATFTVVLTSQPTADVTIGLSSSDTTEGTVLPASLTFTAMNWNVAQTVTVTGVNDSTNDGDQSYSIVTAAAVSADAGYSGRNAADVTVSNTDDDLYNVVVGSISGATTEAGGTATFTLVLSLAPTADVSVGLSSSDTGEGTVSPASVTFTTANWSTPQTVTVTGVNDMLTDGGQTYTIVTAAATSTDGNWAGINPADVTVTNRDDDLIAATPTSPVTMSGAMETWEDGGTATFTVVLAIAPSADVTVPVVSSDTSEGTVSPPSLTFTTTNWSTPQTVTVTGVSDVLSDGTVAYTVGVGPATSTDAAFDGALGGSLSVQNVEVGSVMMVSTGPNYGTCAVKTDNKAYCWGFNANGQLGNGTTSQSTTPTLVSGMLTWQKVVLRNYHACGVTAGNVAYCWGLGTNGRLGTGNISDQSTPTAVDTMLTFDQVTLGQGFACGLTSAGVAHCWGDDASGQLGDGGSSSQSSPVAVSGGLTFSKICSGAAFACGLDSTDGSAHCWGDNGSGQLGIGTTGGTANAPGAVSGMLTFTDLVCAGTSACALTAAGKVHCWGNNASGQLGDGTNTQRTVPTAVAGSETFVKLSTPNGSLHTCALTASGQAYCWGPNGNYQLGDGTTTQRTSPTAVDTTLRFSQISTGNLQTCGISHGLLYCWGNNANGQLGVGDTVARTSPELVTFP